MSLSPLVSFKSRFVTYLLNFPRIFLEDQCLTPIHHNWFYHLTMNHFDYLQHMTGLPLWDFKQSCHLF